MLSSAAALGTLRIPVIQALASGRLGLTARAGMQVDHYGNLWSLGSPAQRYSAGLSPWREHRCEALHLRQHAHTTDTENQRTNLPLGSNSLKHRVQVIAQFDDCVGEFGRAAAKEYFRE